LHTAAVLGKRFDFTDLAVAVPQSESELLDALDEAVATQLIQELEGDAYTFSHDKIREVLYEELNPIRRRRLHQRVGEALERLYIGEKFKQSPISQLPPSLRAHAADLAHHFIHSGDLLRGLDYSLAAATNAESLFEHTLALSHYRHALDCAESLNLVDRQAEILFSMALNYYHHGLLQSALEYYQKALALTEDGRRRAEIMTRIGAAFCMIGDEQGMDYLQSAIHTLDPLTQVNDLAYATALIGRFHHYRADWERAIEYLERARLMAEPLNDAPILTEIYGYLSGAYQQSNQWEKSNEWALRSIELGKRLDHLPAEAMGYEFLGENAYSIGLYRQSLEYAQRDQELGEKIGSLSRRAWAHSCRAHALSGLGDLESAINEANLALNLAEHAGEQRLIVLVRSTRANINLDRGNDEAALEDLHFIMERAMETGQRQMLNWAMHTQINYFLAREEWQAALIEVDRFEELVGIRPVYSEARALIGLEDLEALRPIAALAEEFLTKNQSVNSSPRMQAINYLFLGIYFLLQKKLHESLEMLNQAAVLFEQHESRLDLAFTLERRAQTHILLDNIKNARQDLERAIEIFAACDAARHLARARKLYRTIYA
jgi:tetratricopeptide (TPR) repeat protein